MQISDTSKQSTWCVAIVMWIVNAVWLITYLLYVQMSRQ